MEANKTSTALRLLDNPTVRNIAIKTFVAIASLFTFVFLACYVKAMTGGSWKIPLIIAGLLTAAGLALLYWANSRKIGQ